MLFVNIYFVTHNIKFCKISFDLSFFLCYNIYEEKAERKIALLNTDNFKRGTVDLVVLNVLSEKDMYGYEIVKAVQEKSGGNFELPLGTLYPVLYRFLENGYLSDRDEIVNKRLRKYYHLEEKGRLFYVKLLEEYRKISEGVNMILEGGDSE